ncbi:MAG: hypothetical protein HC893_16210 [Chloroflexaceae bacterium]|nr:hypothetical protein [Chloroflexaceae bacterium]
MQVELLAQPDLLVLQEFWLFPWLPTCLLLLTVASMALRLPFVVVVGVPALLLLVVAALLPTLPISGLLLTGYLGIAAGVVALVLLAALALQHWPTLRPISDRQALRWLAVMFGLAFVLTFDPLVNSDGVGYYAYLRSAFIDGDLQFANEYAAPQVQRAPWSMPSTATEHIANPWSVGPALVWLPLYVVAHLLVLVGQVLGTGWLPDGFSGPYIPFAMATSALAGLVVLLASYRITRRYVAPPLAVLAVVSLFIGTNLLFYTMREGSFAHAVSTASTALYLLAWLRLEERPTLWRWSLLGLAAGLMLVIYWVNALLLVLPALTFGRLLVAIVRDPSGRVWQRGGALLAGVALAAGLALLGFAPQMLAWQIVYGSFLTVPQGQGYASPGSAVWGEFFFSTLRGMLPWTPTLFVALFSSVLLFGRNRWHALCIGLALLVYVWYNASITNWHGSSGFGLRRLSNIVPLVAIGLALLYERLQRWHSVLPSVLAALMASWTLLLLVRHHLFLLPHHWLALYSLPQQALYFSRDALPVQQVPILFYDSYFGRVLLRPAEPTALVQAAALLVTVAAAAWGVLYLFRVESPGD